MDLYRLDEAREVATLGLDEIFERDALVLIEWGERFPRLLPAERTEIRIRASGGRRKGNRSHSPRTSMNKQPWALILGASSGFGEATALELARAGMNIFGVHLDRRDKLQHVEEIQEKIRALRPRIAVRQLQRLATTTAQGLRGPDLARRMAEPPGTLRVLLHSLAFGALKPLVGAEEVVSRHQLELTADVMGNSLVYWVQECLWRGCSIAGRAFSP